ncbi:MAG: hypothetical protein WCQ50_19005 [Spirochaetota bacterium]
MTRTSHASGRVSGSTNRAKRGLALRPSWGPGFRLALALLPLLSSLHGLPIAAESQSYPAILPEADPFLASLGAATLAAGPGAVPSLDDLIEAGLRASGVATQDLSARKAAVNGILDSMAAALREGNLTSRAEQALEWLHTQRLLGVYSERATTLVDILDSRCFNCVSSANLYLLAMRRLDIACGAVQTPDHAFCIVRIDGKAIDVETTNRYGFDPGTRREFTDSFGKATGYNYVPPGAYSKRNQIGPLALVALILSNRSAMYEESHRYQDSLTLAVSYVALVPGPAGLDFVVGRINNRCAELSQAGTWSEMRSLALAGRERYGNLPALAKLAAEAQDSYLASIIDTKPLSEAAKLVLAAAASGDITMSRRNEFIVYLYGSEANRIGARGDWLAAAALAESGSALIGGGSRLSQAAANYYHNYAAGVHNRFAELYNAGKRTQARAVLQEGLAALPGDPLLTRDLSALQ